MRFVSLNVSWRSFEFAGNEGEQWPATADSIRRRRTEFNWITTIEPSSIYADAVTLFMLCPRSTNTSPFNSIWIFGFHESRLGLWFTISRLPAQISWCQSLFGVFLNSNDVRVLLKVKATQSNRPTNTPTIHTGAETVLLLFSLFVRRKLRWRRNRRRRQYIDCGNSPAIIITWSVEHTRVRCISMRTWAVVGLWVLSECTSHTCEECCNCFFLFSSFSSFAHIDLCRRRGRRSRFSSEET